MVAQLAGHKHVRTCRPRGVHVVVPRAAQYGDPTDVPPATRAQQGRQVQCRPDPCAEGVKGFRRGQGTDAPQRHTSRVSVLARPTAEGQDTVQSQHSRQRIVDAARQGVQPGMEGGGGDARTDQAKHLPGGCVGTVHGAQTPEEQGMVRHQQVASPPFRRGDGVLGRVQCHQNAAHRRRRVGTAGKSVVVPSAGQRPRNARFQRVVQLLYRHVRSLSRIVYRICRAMRASCAARAVSRASSPAVV